ncbi:MAG: exopolyphosphatase, partial [Mycobacteriales bacterium]
RVTRDLLSRTPQQRLEYAVMHPGRADVIGGGALILRRIMERVGMAEVLASESDILDGIALSLV